MSLADKNKHESTIYRNFTAENKYSMLDIDSWFGPEIEYSMIFMFLSSIVSIIAFIILIILCYRNSKVHYALTSIMGIKNANAAVLQPEYATLDFLYLHFIIGILILVMTYFAIKLFLKLCL